MGQNFYYGVYLPSLARKVYFKELDICQLKVIIKTILNSDDTALSLCFNEIVKANCKEDASKLDLTTLDRFIALLNMRVVSMGGSQKLQVTCEETQKIFSISYDYNQLITQLEETVLDKPKSSYQNGITVEFGLPLAARSFSTENVEFNKLVNSIRCIKIGETEYNLATLDFYDLTRIIENLPRVLTNDILEYLELQEIKINKVNFLNVENPFTFKKIIQLMSFDEAVLNRILKLAFKEDLLTLYKSIYYMVHVLKFTPEYVENMTYNEKQLYWSYYLADEKEKQKSANNQAPSRGIPQMHDATQDFLKEM